jgi:H+-translocating NAD(P) transhydrogenase subunit alpha
MTTVLIPKELRAGEHRVAAIPETVKRLLKEGFAVEVAAGAGVGSHIADGDFAAAGATVVDAARPREVVLKVAPPTVEEAGALAKGSLLIAFLAPHRNLDVVATLAERGVTSLAMELLPRVTRAQPMDALSSQASIAGYKAVLLAADRLAKYFPLLMTAAGTVSPAKVVILGAGVAGLQALATAKRLGAVVEVSDVRPAVKEQVESLGGRFIEPPGSAEGEGGYAREVGEDFLRRQQETLQRHLEHANVVITTAMVPGKPAPRLVPEEVVARMRPGSIIVDLAAESGGNCALTEPDAEVTRHGVRIIGFTNLPSMVAEDASMLYARNVLSLLLHVSKKGELALDLDDEIVRGALLTHEGNVVHPATAEAMKGVTEWARS